MGAAITLLVILTFSVVIVRTAAVALRLTGMPADIARFQARSAFSGAGFTTAESEAVVNHPVRRRLISLLMLYGNIGLVTVAATFVVSFVATESSMAAISRQVFWLLLGVALLWFIALNPIADRVMCSAIDWLLQRTTSLSQAGTTVLLQVTNDYSIAEHAIPTSKELTGTSLSDLYGESVTILGIEHDDGSYSSSPPFNQKLTAGDRIIVYGSDNDHRVLNSTAR